GMTSILPGIYPVVKSTKPSAVLIDECCLAEKTAKYLVVAVKFQILSRHGGALDRKLWSAADIAGEDADQGQRHGDGQSDRRGDEGSDDVLAQNRRDDGRPDDLTDAVPRGQLRRGVRDTQLRADADRHHDHSDEGEAEEGGGDDQHDRRGAENREQPAEDLQAVAESQS